jgi:hypothetical protein
MIAYHRIRAMNCAPTKNKKTATEVAVFIDASKLNRIALRQAQ